MSAEIRPGTPVLYMSGYAQPFVEAGGDVGPVDLIPKPFTAQALRERVARLFEKAAGPA